MPTTPQERKAIITPFPDRRGIAAVAGGGEGGPPKERVQTEINSCWDNIIDRFSHVLDWNKDFTRGAFDETVGIKLTGKKKDRRPGLPPCLRFSPDEKVGSVSFQNDILPEGIMLDTVFFHIGKAKDGKEYAVIESKITETESLFLAVGSDGHFSLSSFPVSPDLPEELMLEPIIPKNKMPIPLFPDRE